MINPADSRCALLLGGLLLALSVAACGADTESLDARRCSVDEDCASGMCDEGVCVAGGDNNPTNNNPANNNPANNNPSNNSAINNNPSNNNPGNNNPGNNNPGNNNPGNNNPVACVEDALSPNHRYADAYALSPADVLGELMLCEASPDFFALGLGLAEQATVEVTVDDVDAAVELAVYNPGNLELAAPDQVIPADDGLITAVFGAGGEGTFYVVVRGASAEVRYAYGLGVSVETLCEPAEEICDGLDNDCDGEEDEGCDDDDDGVCDAGMTLAEGGAPTCPQGGGDCDDDDAHRFPGNAEVCSGQLPDGRAAAAHDEDCDPCTVAGGLGDGDVDGDDYPAASCVNDWVGAEAPTACALTTTRLDEVNRRVIGADCRDAAADGASFNPDRAEVCNAQDDDCDGEVDEGPDGSPLACDCTTPGEERVCGTDTGACTQGTQTCLANGTWTACSGVMPSAEVCDAARVDEDCDGEANPAALCACDGNEEELCEHLQGVCAGGTRRCNGQGQWGACSIAPSTEVCDAAELDEDCDGRENEGCDCIPGVTPPTTSGCSNQTGVCSGSMRSCQSDGRWGTCSRLPGTEVCGGGDEDCDGSTDEGSIGTTWYRDEDDDGYRGTATIVRCVRPSGYVSSSAGTDCNDRNQHLWRTGGVPPVVPLTDYPEGYCYSPFVLSARYNQSCPSSPKTSFLHCPDGYKGSSVSVIKVSGGGSWSYTSNLTSTNSYKNAYIRVVQYCSGLEGTSVDARMTCTQDTY